VCLLHAAASRRGWEILPEFEDAGIGSAKGQEDRPGFGALLEVAALRRKGFDVVKAWSVDRLGRSLIHLISGLPSAEGTVPLIGPSYGVRHSDTA